MISCVINLDTRDGFDGLETTAEGLFSGCKSVDFLVEGIKNKKKFLEGFDHEIIAFIDIHNKVPDNVLKELNRLCDTLVLRKHTDEPKFNDWNYYKALSIASGDIICHFDQDTACFTSGKEYVDELISHLDNHKFVSYPSYWTPNPVHDDSFGGKFWASTRFFMCKREDLKLDELAMCIKNPQWMYDKYGDSPRRCDWTEHFLAKINGNSVYYPPVELHKGAIFSWKTYRNGVLKPLNELPYEAIKQWILHRGGIVYPCDLVCE